MKTLNLLIIVLVTLFVSCGKDDNNVPEVNPESIQGRWELRDRFGGYRDEEGVAVDYEFPHSVIIEFSGQRFMLTWHYHDRVETSEGTYEIAEVEATEIDGTEYRHKIIYTAETEYDTPDQFVRLSGNQLMFSVGPMSSDGFTNTYEKI